MGFLLYGREKTTSQYILQKLIVLQQNPPKGKGTAEAGNDILRQYATINTTNWRVNIVEALAIIRAKKVLRKLGFVWQELHDVYLPHIPEISLHIHPLLKALYKICERLSVVQAGRMIMKINEKHLRHEAENLRFYDYSNLEVFLLFWITRDVIAIGDDQLQGADVLNLISYFKVNDLDSMKSILIETLNHNSARENLTNTSNKQAVNVVTQTNVPINSRIATNRENTETNKDSGAVMDSLDMDSGEQIPQTNGMSEKQEEFDYTERYVIRRQHAGYVLIINQNEFYADPNPEVKVINLGKE